MDTKTLIVYYSFEGNSKMVAEEIAGRIGGDVVRLEPEQDIPRSGLGKFVSGGLKAMTRASVALKPLDVRPADYDRIVIACPVWAGTYPPAIGTFLDGYGFSGKDVWLVACSKSGNAKRLFAQLGERLAGNRVLGTLSLVSPLEDPDQAKARIEMFCGEMASA